MAIRSSPDRGLQVRMTVLALLIVVANVIFVTLVLEAGLYYATVVSDLLGLGSQQPVFKRRLEDDWLAVFSVTVMFMLAQYWYVRHSVLRSSSVQSDAPETTDLEQRLTRLASQASVTLPSVAVVDSPTPNSYTVGRQGNATIVVSTGLLETLDDAELDTVLAHELAHVLNHDVTVMTMAVAPFRLARLLVWTLKRFLATLALAIYYLLYLGVVLVTIVMILLLVVAGFIAVIDPGPTAEKEMARGAAQWFFGTVIGHLTGFTAILLAGGLFLIPVVLLLSVYYIILGMIPQRLSIYREYAADRGAALLTGTPTTFASALESLSNATDQPTADLRQATDVQALCLVSGGISDDTENDSTQQSSSDDLSLLEAVQQRISTGIVAHPPIEERIDRLREMSKNLEEK